MMKFEKGTMTEWQPATKKPDADTTVLVFAPRHVEPVCTGYWDGEVWRDYLDMPYAAHVEMWAELPYPVECKAMKAKECSARESTHHSAATHSPAKKLEAACLL